MLASRLAKILSKTKSAVLFELYSRNLHLVRANVTLQVAPVSIECDLLEALCALRILYLVLKKKKNCTNRLYKSRLLTDIYGRHWPPKHLLALVKAMARAILGRGLNPIHL